MKKIDIFKKKKFKYHITVDPGCALTLTCPYEPLIKVASYRCTHECEYCLSRSEDRSGPTDNYIINVTCGRYTW